MPSPTEPRPPRPQAPEDQGSAGEAGGPGLLPCERPRGRGPAERPLLALGLALLLGQGLSLGLGAPGGRFAGCCLPLGWILLTASGRWVPGRRAAKARRPRRFPLALAFAACSSAWSSAAELERFTTPGGLPSATGAGALSGRFRPSGPRTGRLETQAGRPASPLLAFDGPRPRANERVVILPPGERRPYARGPNTGHGLRTARAIREGDELWLVEPEECVRLLPARSLSALVTARIEPLRRSLVHRLERAFGEGRPQQPSGIGRALLVGDRSELGAETADLFTRTGTRHLLALSGFHVGVFALTCLNPLLGLLGWLAQRIGLHASSAKRLRHLGLAFACLLFVPLAGGSSPVSRAGVAASLFALAGVCLDRRHPVPVGLRAPWRRADLPSAFGLALILAALGDPLAAGDPGFLLSFAATAGIAFGALPIARRLPGTSAQTNPLHDLIWLQATPRRMGRLAVRRLVHLARLGLAASLAATLATLPIVWSVFGEWSWVGPLATLVLTPMVLVWMPLLWIAALTGLQMPAAMALGTESLVLELLGWFDRFPATPLALPPRPLWLLLCATGLTFLALLRRSATSGRFAALAFAGLLAPGELAPRGLELRVLDVGHGCAMVLRAPGLPALVFDAGSRDRPGVARRALGPLLRRFDPGEVVTVCSHTDADHRKALPWVASRFPTRVHGGALLPEHEQHLLRRTRRVDFPSGRRRLELGPGPLGLHLVRGADLEGNEGSRTLVIEIAGESIILAGDAVAEGLDAELNRGWLPTRPRLLVAPHHGSFGAAVARELDALEPREIWVSVSGSPPMAGEYARRGLPVRITGRDGPLALDLPESHTPPGPRADDPKRPQKPIKSH